MKPQQLDPHSSRLLFVDDEEKVLEHVASHLRPAGYEVITARNWAEAEDHLDRSSVPPELIFIEPLAADSGLDEGDLLEKVCQRAGDSPVIVLSYSRHPKAIVEAVQAGVRDYICKPFKISELQSYIHRVLENGEDQSPRRRYSEAPKVDFISENSQMKQIKDMILRIKDTKVPVLIHGESGVGKEVVARHVHQESFLSDQPFVKVPCAAIPTELVESELFGFKKGAFTGAHIDKAGKFEIAHQGTIFLDEIGELGAPVQAKFLHVLQEGRYARLGSNEEIDVDVRIVAATNRNLDKAIADGSFREDLYYRLNVVNIEIAPLRCRRDEIPVFCEYFLKRFAKEYNRPSVDLPEELKSLFELYHWPGNVRELENLVKRFVVLQDAESVHKELEDKIEKNREETINDTVGNYLNREDGGGWDLKQIRKEAVSVVEKNMIERALRRTHGNKWQAAKELKVSYKTLLMKIDEYGIGPGSEK